MNKLYSFIWGVCEKMEINQADIFGSSRKTRVSDARKMISFWAITNGFLIDEIAFILDKHRTSIYYCIKRHRELMKIDRKYKNRYAAILKKYRNDVSET